MLYEVITGVAVAVDVTRPGYGGTQVGVGLIGLELGVGSGRARARDAGCAAEEDEGVV